MTTKPAYAAPGSVGIPNLDPFFDPGAPPLPDAEPPDDLMLQNPDIHYALQILYDLVVGDRTDVFIDTNSNRLLRPQRPQPAGSARRLYRLRRGRRRYPAS